MPFDGNVDTAGCCRFVAATASLFNQTVTVGPSDWIEIVGMPILRVTITLLSGPAPAAPGWFVQVAMRGDAGIQIIPAAAPILLLGTPATELMLAVVGSKARVFLDTTGGQTYRVTLMASS